MHASAAEAADLPCGVQPRDGSAVGPEDTALEVGLEPAEGLPCEDAQAHRDERPGVRVLYTSGYTENVMMRSGFEEGLMLLAKPFLPADLLRKVREALGPAA